MRIDTLVASLQTVLNEFPDAEYELGECTCCIYIVVNGKRVAAYVGSVDEFQYLVVPPTPNFSVDITKLSPFNRTGK